MAYDPAEGNNPYDDAALAKEWEEWEANVKAGRINHKSPAEVRELKNMFCTLLAKGCTISNALAQINGDEAFFGAATSRLGRKTVYMWRQYDPEFKEAWNAAYAAGSDLLEQRITDYALEVDPKQINNILRYRNPTRYGTTRQEVSGPGGGPLNVETIELVAATEEDGQGSD